MKDEPHFANLVKKVFKWPALIAEGRSYLQQEKAFAWNESYLQLGMYF